MTQLPDWTQQQQQPQNAQGQWAEATTNLPDSGYSSQATVTVGMALDSDRAIQARKADFLRLDRQTHANILQMIVEHAGKGILDRREPLPIASRHWLMPVIENARRNVLATDPSLYGLTPGARMAAHLAEAMKLHLLNDKPADQSIVSTLLYHQIDTYDWQELATQVLQDNWVLLQAMSYGGLAEVILATVDWVALAADMEDDYPREAPITAEVNPRNLLDLS